ncbi:MAG: protein kinase domain-containing protein [Pseudonocardiaceae bacterium]
MWAWGKTRRLDHSTEEIDGYRDLVQVGRGGFGVVYRARQEYLDREVAVKVLAVPALDKAALTRFVRECRLTSRLTGHPNVVTVLDTGTARSGRPYVVTEYFEHGSLKQRLDRDGPLPLTDVLRIGVKIAGALAAAHDAGILHRDIKPENILISGYSEPALADFGVARLLDASDLSTRTDALTLHHTAPEVLEDTPPGPASDVYALGSTLYQLLAGFPAHRRGTDEGIAPVLRRILTEDPPDITRPDVPEQVMAVIRKAMAKRQQDRFADPLALATALQHLQAEYGFAVTELPPAKGGTQCPAQIEQAAAPPPQSNNTVKRLRNTYAEGHAPRPEDPDTSSTILRPRAPHVKAASTRWRLVLASMLSIIAVVGAGLLAWRMWPDPHPAVSAHASSPSSAAPSSSTAAVSPSSASTPPPTSPPQVSAIPTPPFPPSQAAPGRQQPAAPQFLPFSPPPAVAVAQPTPIPQTPSPEQPPPTVQLAPAPQETSPATQPEPSSAPEPKISGYHIQNINSQMCLTTSADAEESPLRQVLCDTNDSDQHWEAIYSTDKIFQIRNVSSGKCIAARGAGESPAVATGCGSWSDQHWYETLDPSGGVRFHNINSSECLVTRTDQIGTQAVQSGCGDYPDQIWNVR